MAIPALPAAPSRADPANFADKADAWVAALPDWTVAVNVTAGQVQTNANNAASASSTAVAAIGSASIQAGIAQSSANAAAMSASEAASSAASAVNAPGTSASSSTSLTIGTGSKSLTIETGKQFTIGQTVVIAYTSNPANYMVGQITAFTSGSGSMTVNVTSIGGSGTFAAWSVAITAIAPVLSVNGSAGAITGLATVTGTETLTNKTMTSPVINQPNIRENLAYINTSTTAVAGRGYLLDANIVLTLPSGPTAGDRVFAQTYGSYLTASIGRGGQNIMGLAQDMTLDVAYARVELVYLDATRGWVIV